MIGYEDIKSVPSKSLLGNNCVTEAPLESPVSRAITTCEDTTQEIFERIQHLMNLLQPVLIPPYPQEANKLNSEKPAIAAVAERLYLHNDQLRKCVENLAEIRDRLAI